MEPFPFIAEEWSEINHLASVITNATLADDTALQESVFIELVEILGKLRAKYGDHPVLLETEADFEADPSQRLVRYRQAIRVAERFGLPTLSIRLSLATLLLEDFNDASKARHELIACEKELHAHDDQGDIDNWSDLLRKCNGG
jgi:hypothetical protein